MGAGNIGGLTIVPNIYKWGTGVLIPTDVTLSGGANDVWIFQIAQTLDLSSNVKINLSGGAQAKNIFWVVGGQTTVGTGAVLNGNVLDETAIVLNTGAVLNGRALAQTAVTLDANAVTTPKSEYASGQAPAPTPTPTPTPILVPTPVTLIIPTSPSIVYPSTNVLSFSYTIPTPVNNVDFVETPKELGVIVPVATIQNTVIAKPIEASFVQQVKVLLNDLMRGLRNNDVKILQQFLISENKGVAAESLARVGATSYFGVLTQGALAEFQAKTGIFPPQGYFGPITRKYLNTNY